MTSLLTELGALLRRCDPVPARVISDAEAAFALAGVPSDWLEPLAAPLVGVRSGGRTFRFGDGDLRLEVELRRLAWHLTLVGLITPVLDVEVLWPNGVRRVRPDGTGLFRVDDLPRVPLRLVVASRSTRWFGP
jgi:hypothetical protein